MRARDDALNGVLNSLRSRRDAPWREKTFDARALTDEAFEQHVAALCQTAEAVRSAQSRDGGRGADDIKRRVLKRESEWTRRTALDLQRLADIEDRMRVRQAESARKRWFVLGRLLMRAASEDPRWGDVINLLISSTKMSALEARALGVPQRKS